MEWSFCTAPAARNPPLQILFKCRSPAIVFGNATKPSHFAHFWQGGESLAPATKLRFNVQKRREHVLPSRHNSVHFLKISTSKSAPRLACFVHFDFEMCFAPQRRALFEHRNFEKCSERGVFCTFCLRNMQRHTLFRHLNFQKWFERGVLCTF